MSAILLIDDNPEILEANFALFSELGFNVTLADTGVKAVAALNNKQFDCIVLDILLPDLDGYTICKAARTVTTAPIIFLTCLDEVEEKVKGLMSGGDDYLTKPYRLEELAARVQALIRRNEVYTKETVPQESFYIDKENRMIHTPKGNTFLTQKEFELLLFFQKFPGRIFSREELLKHIWGEELRDNNTVGVHIMRLRRKLEDAKDYIGHIESNYGEGYRLVLPAEDEKQ